VTTPALVFDLDGTLVDTAPDLLAALNVVLAEAGRPAVGMTELRHLVGYGVKTLIEEAMKKSGEPASATLLPVMIENYIAYYRANIAVKSRPFPGVEATLRALAGRGARLGVLTNKPQALADQLMQSLGLAQYFDAIHGAGRLSVAKPDPRVFQEIIAELGGSSRGAIMIGDSATDVATARAAYVPVILVSYGYTPQSASELGADRVTDDFADVPRLVDELLDQRPD